MPGLAALLVLLLTLPGIAGGQASPAALAPVNGVRDASELPPLVPDASLDALAADYLAQILSTRCLCPPPIGDAAADTLLDDVAAALGTDYAVLDAGLIVSYDLAPSVAITTATLDPAHAAAVLSPRLRMTGIATGQIELGDEWLAPPPGADGPPIDLTGYTLVVMITAGVGE